MWIKDEDRHKTNEAVIFRPDISTIVAYCPPVKAMSTAHAMVLSTEIVLVSEFRSPANNPTAMVTEIPGGSSFKPGVAPETIAADEMHEETGLVIEAKRFRMIGVRQIAATLAAHRAYCYAVKLTSEEMLSLKWEAGKAHGNHEDTEYTFVTATTVANMLTNPNIDWSNLGMVFQALSV
jgi:8-oxo-dGTP pyrophosphatase MutT (NUDIX family)